MSTAAVTPFRSFVQTPIFSVSPSSFSLQARPANIVINIITQESFRSSYKRPYSPSPYAVFSIKPIIINKPTFSLPFEL